MTETLIGKTQKIADIKKIVKKLQKEKGFNIEENEENGLIITAEDFSVEIFPKLKTDLTIEYNIHAKVKKSNETLEKALAKYVVKQKEYSLLEIAEVIIKNKDAKDLKETVSDATGLDKKLLKKYFDEIKSQGKSKYANKTIKSAAKIID